ncbi:MAG TPA: hypothetical protein VE988_00585, partial [Gemmataceae bacterium]|nr:hypothetical protein [Gemmataceae bacterium]
MTVFQFDQCLDDKKIIRKCKEEGLAEVFRLPRNLRDAEDPVVLSTLLTRPNPLVTVDRGIAVDHAAAIPDAHPGLVIVSHDPDSPRTMTTGQASRILAAFKQRYPDWHQTSLANSVIEITPGSVEIWHVLSGQLLRDEFLAFA